MQRYKFLCFITLLMFMFSCETEQGRYGGYKMDYDSKLQHYIVLDKSDTFSISRGDDRDNISPYPGTFLKWHKSDNTIDTCFYGKGAIVLNTFINEVKNDDKFIIVDQTLLSKICECNLQCLEEKYGKEAYTTNSFDLCKKALEESNIHDYWIINKHTDDIYGPYELDKYLIMRNKLNIPSNLKLETEL